MDCLAHEYIMREGLSKLRSHTDAMTVLGGKARFYWNFQIERNVWGALCLGICGFSTHIHRDIMHPCHYTHNVLPT